jgi:hypothetical protein
VTRQRGAPDVDPKECLASLAGKPHIHEVVCAEWRRLTEARVERTARRAW